VCWIVGQIVVAHTTNSVIYLAESKTMTVTTTDILHSARIAADEGRDNLAKDFAELDDRLSAGLPLPDQWRTSPRDIVERWATQPGTDRKAEIRLHSRGGCSVRLTTNERLPDRRIFAARTPDEVYQLAAEYLAQSG
jgi:hypothetical protein